MDTTTTTLLPQTQRQSPLDIPEILIRIGQFLPLWSGEGFRLEFDPSPLLRCCLVSRAFRQAFLPTLWYLYDGYRMRNIPSTILSRYSPYFRIITSTGPFKGPFQCKNLTELNTVYGQEWSRALLVSNPNLKRLVWGGPFSRRIETLEQQQEWQLELKVLMGLENLDEIRMSGFSLGEGIFVKLLRNNASSLSNLAMSTVAGVTSIEGLELPHLTELQVTFGCAESPALLDVVRCCPRLQRLSLLGSKTRASAAFVPPHHQQQHQQQQLQAGQQVQELGSEVVRLAQNITECCPELSHIKFTTTSTTGGAQTNAVFRNQSFLQGPELALIAHACGRLEGFTAELATLDQALTFALMAHSSTLKSLSLTFHETDLETNTRIVDRTREMISLRRLKASLSNLQDLHLDWAGRLSANIVLPPGATAGTTTRVFTTTTVPVFSTPALGPAATTATHPPSGPIGVAPQTTPTTAAAAGPAASLAVNSEEMMMMMNAGRNAFAVQEEVAMFLEEPWAGLELETLRLHGMFRSAPPTPTLTAGPAEDEDEDDGVSMTVGDKSRKKRAKVVWRLAKGAHSEATSSPHHHHLQLNSVASEGSSRGSSRKAEQQTRLLENVTGLTRLRHLCFNYTTYERIPLL
ncbi:hypothetical protein EC957_006425 [Mortierella hygrophila]|uniref:Uncharacterized protein n=1 Tax=Mortierella hygrophila TaxID=979708 RepID=A0A9P6EY25_9FUNG|nr:hypothetical protein EC957_006425 [Mortierella hygrophila]